MDLEQTLRDYIIRERCFDQPPEDFDDDYDLIDSGILDSLALLNLMSYLETQYQVPFNRDALLLENFSSVYALSNYLRSQLR